MLTSYNIISLQQRGLLDEVFGPMDQHRIDAHIKMHVNVPAENLIGMVNRLEDSGINITPYQLDEAMRLVPLVRAALIDDYGTDIGEQVIDALSMVFLGCVTVHPVPPEFFGILNQAIQYVYQ